MSLLLHPAEQTHMQALTKNPPHALLVVAPTGSGKESVLRELAATLLGPHPSGRLFEVQPEDDKKHIGIDEIRPIKGFVKLSSDKQRVILIPNAEYLTVEAQNSLLKLIEEPPKNVVFLLSVARKELLLDTVVSRTHIWQLRAPTNEQLTQYFTTFDHQKLQRVMAIADGRVGLITALLDEADAEHELLTAINLSKELLQESKFERMCQVEVLSKDPVGLKNLLEALELTAHAGLSFAAKKDNTIAIAEWRRKLLAIAEAQKFQTHSVQAKLLLSNLFVRL